MAKPICRLACCSIVAVTLAGFGCGGSSTPAPPPNFAKEGVPDDEVQPFFDGPKSGKLKIVSSLPRSGKAKTQTDGIVNGIKLALEKVGHKIGDFEIEYEDSDNSTGAGLNSQRELTNAQRAVGDPDVLVYIVAPNLGDHAASIPILDKAKVLVIGNVRQSHSINSPTEGANQRDKSKEFVEAYRKNFGEVSDYSYGIFGYECAQIALQVMRRAAVKNREAVKWHARRIKSAKGELGKWSFVPVFEGVQLKLIEATEPINE